MPRKKSARGYRLPKNLSGPQSPIAPEGSSSGMILDAAERLGLPVNSATHLQWIREEKGVPKGLRARRYRSKTDALEIYGAYDRENNILYVIEFTV